MYSLVQVPSWNQQPSRCNYFPKPASSNIIPTQESFTDQATHLQQSPRKLSPNLRNPWSWIICCLDPCWSWPWEKSVSICNMHILPSLLYKWHTIKSAPYGRGGEKCSCSTFLSLGQCDKGGNVHTKSINLISNPKNKSTTTSNNFLLWITSFSCWILEFKLPKIKGKYWWARFISVSRRRIYFHNLV